MDEIDAILERDEDEALLHVARRQAGRVLRYLSGRLCSAGEEEKWRAVRALGVVVRDWHLVSLERATDLLRRFVWALNHESGVVPYGVPEAMGEILAVRPELQRDFLPILCSMVTDVDMLQTGPIERGVLWALGRVGAPVARCSPEAVEALRSASETHPDPESRQVAAGSLAVLANAPASL
jgi:hypothetical protein